MRISPNLHEQLVHPKRHVTFALSEQKTAYPAHTRELYEDEDDQLLVQPTSRKEPVEEKRESAAARRVPAQVRIRKGPPAWQDPSSKLEKEVSENSSERSEEVSILGSKADREATNKLQKGSLRNLHLKHYHMSVAQFKRRTNHLDILGMIYDLHHHVVKIHPFCKSTKPRPDRSRVSGFRAEEFGELIFLDHGSTKWRQNLWISYCLGWSDITFDSISMPKYVSIGSCFQSSRVDGHFPDEPESNLCRHGFPPSS